RSQHTLGLEVGQRQASDRVIGVHDDEVVVGLFHADTFTSQALSNEDAGAVPGDVAGGGDLSQDGSGRVVDLRGGRGSSSPAGWAGGGGGGGCCRRGCAIG